MPAMIVRTRKKRRSNMALLLDLYVVVGLEFSHGCPGTFPGLFRGPHSLHLVANRLKARRHRGLTRIQPGDVPAVLGLDHMPFADRQAKQPGAKIIAE